MYADRKRGTNWVWWLRRLRTYRIEVKSFRTKCRVRPRPKLNQIIFGETFGSPYGSNLSLSAPCEMVSMIIWEPKGGTNLRVKSETQVGTLKWIKRVIGETLNPLKGIDLSRGHSKDKWVWRGTQGLIQSSRKYGRGSGWTPTGQAHPKWAWLLGMDRPDLVTIRYGEFGKRVTRVHYRKHKV